MRTRLLTITLAVVLALLGAVAVLAYARQANQRALNGLKAETVVVATGSIPADTSLAKAQQGGLLSTEKVPTSSLTNPPVRSVTAANENEVVSGAVAKGQVLLKNMLASAADVAANGGFVIPRGMFAVAVNLCIPEAVANYLVPGSSVAVFDTVAGKGSQVQRSCEAQHTILNSNVIANPKKATTVLVLKAQVLAVGQNLATTNTAAGNNVAATTDPSSSSATSAIQGETLVTLAVDQADAQRLILIDELGMPYLALLGPGSSVTLSSPVQLFQQQP